MIQRTDGRWMDTIMIDGRRKYFYGKTKAEVSKKMRSYKQTVKGSRFGNIIDKWYEEHTRHVRYKTAESYVRPLAELREEFGDKDITDITSPMIASFVRQLEHRGYARRTVQLRLDILRMIFRYAITELGEVQTNPASDVRLSEGLPQESRQLASREDIGAIITHKDDDRFSYLPFLLMWTGMRLCEALAISDDCIRDGMIYVDRQISWEPNQPVLAPVKTKKGERVIPILDVLALPKFKGYLFSMDDDGAKPLTKSAFTKRWRAYSKRTGVTCDRHTLRHEFATVLYDANVDIKEAAEMMGHDEKVMLGIYTHIREERRHITADKINRFVNSLSKSL